MDKTKNKKTGCISLCVILISVIIIVCCFSCNSCGAKQDDSSGGSKSSISATDFSKADLTETTIKNAITNSLIKGKITNVAVKDGNVSIDVYSEDFLDEKNVITQNQPDSADVFKDLFKDKKVKLVSYRVSVPVNDSYGNKSKEPAITTTLTRDKADKIKDWDTFKSEAMSQYYSVAEYQLAPESKISGLHKAWADVYK